MSLGLRRSRRSTGLPSVGSVAGKVMVSGRTFSRDGQPFLWVADTAWALLIKLTREQVTQYLDTRQSQGFTVVQIAAIFPFAGGPGPNAYGDRPYGASLNDRPSLGYWDHLDWVVAAAADRKMVVAVAPCWADGQQNTLITSANAYAYGQFLASRLAAAPNVAWLLGGDQPGGDYQSLWQALADGLDSGSTLVESYLPRNDQTSTSWFNDAAWIDFHMINGGQCLHYSTRRTLAAAAYANTGARPWVDGQPLQEERPICDNTANGYSTADQVRRDAYWSMLGGAAGFTYGHHAVWQFYSGTAGVGSPLTSWSNAITQNGAQQVQYVRQLFTGRPRLEPANALVIDPGVDTGWTPAATDAAGSTIVVYFPDGAPHTINLNALSGTSCQPWWFNPQTGAVYKASAITSTGNVIFNVPTGATDWVLVLDDVAAGYAAPGTPVSALPATFDVTTYGANGGDSSDDTSAINAAFTAATVGSTILFPPGNYRHNAVLRIAKAGVTINGFGATLTATSQSTSAFDVNADNVTINDLKFTATGVTQRWESSDQHKLTVIGNSGVRLNRVQVLGSAGAGIYLEGASNYVVTDVVVQDTRADAIHQTGGSHDGQVIRPTVNNPGDDGVAVVSYGSDSDRCHDILIDSPTVNGQTWGRGISVVGGENITYRNVRVTDSNGAAVYIACEPSYSTRAVTHVRIEGATILRGNTNSGVGHGAVLIYNGRSGYTINDVVMQDFTITDTPTSAPRWVGVIVEGGGAVTGAQFNRFALNGTGPSDIFTPGGSWSATGWTRNGSPVTPN